MPLTRMSPEAVSRLTKVKANITDFPIYIPPSPPDSDSNYGYVDLSDSDEDDLYKPGTSKTYCKNSKNSYKDLLNDKNSKLTNKVGGDMVKIQVELNDKGGFIKRKKVNDKVLGETAKCMSQAELFPNVTNSLLNMNRRCSTSKSFQPDDLVLKCLTCKHIINKNIDFKRHLLFGAIECLDCGIKFKDCSTFIMEFVGSTCRTGCSHNFSWLQNSAEYLEKKLKPKDGFSGSDKYLFRRSVRYYIETLKPLWETKPWSIAIDVCRIYFSLPKLEINFSTQNKKYTHIALPHSDRYLIVKEAIEECPDCYSKLELNGFTFNIQSSLISGICSSCRLPIYFVFTPPCNCEPLVKITQ